MRRAGEFDPPPTVMIVATEVVETTTDSIDWIMLIVGFAGGLALFLYGMDRMTESLRVIVGDRARRILERLTSNRFTGLLTGAGVTAVVQSSSVTTVLLVGFVTAGLMTFEQTIPVILGSNIGTTITAQIIAFNVAGWALGFVAVGYLVSSLSTGRHRRARGMAIVGLGLIFLGMTVMSEAMEPLRTYEPFIDAMALLDNLLVAVIVGALFTALVQSSSATTGVVIVLAGQGLISLDAGVALVLGANIGTAFTAVLSAIGKPVEAKRVAGAHVMFNVIGVLIWLPFVDQLVSFVSTIGGGIQREIANAHTIFNVINALLFLPFVSQFAAFVTWLIPDRAPAGAIEPRYVDPSLASTPQLALSKARMEMLRMASRVQAMLLEVLPAILDGDLDTFDRIEEMDDEVDELHGLVLEFLGLVSQEQLSDESSAELVDLLEATNALEAIGDIVETNLVALGQARMASGVEVSEETRHQLEKYHRAVVRAFEMALIAVTQKDPDAARQVAKAKKRINERELQILQRLSDRLVIDEPNRVATYRFEVDVLTQLKRVYYFTRRIARVAVPEREQAILGATEES
ncbi:MAG: Na/Pi cotransporter family protein [Acidimicrobiia bacterium]|nr:Na/Pi cotransporter family protein [Acidimicrobiia bacterium]